MPKNKKRGTNAERELIHMFWAKDWTACRVAGSGSMRYPAPDIIASKKGKILAIECKITKNKQKYIKKQEINALKEYSKKAGAKPLIAIKFPKQEWIFLEPESFKETETHYTIETENAKEKGKQINHITKNL
ncbi:Holliday junction resolvase [Candidatus Woesearchaeota archaeon]|nr:MAG: Holliday junction resolvase [Candidatus Woesearchaeota archaeon]